jgi:hypothetical protein
LSCILNRAAGILQEALVGALGSARSPVELPLCHCGPALFGLNREGGGEGGPRHLASTANLALPVFTLCFGLLCVCLDVSDVSFNHLVSVLTNAVSRLRVRRVILNSINLEVPLPLTLTDEYQRTDQQSSTTSDSPPVSKAVSTRRGPADYVLGGKRDFHGASRTGGPGGSVESD